MEYKFNDNEVRQQFVDFMQANDCEPIEDLYIQLDGKIHRYKVQGDKSGDKSGAYCIFSDHWPAGWVQNWRNGAAISWCYERDRLDDEGKSYFTDEKYKKALSISRKHQDKLKREREAACIKASETVRIFTETLPNATNDFPYLVKKSVFAIGYLKFNPASKQLCLPLTDIEGNVKSMQYIDAEGNKKFHPGTSTTGVFFGYQLDRLDKEPDLPILITEGYATLATVASRLDYPCVAAMTCHNLLPVAADLKKKYPGHKIIIMADNDHMTKGNPGLTKAREAEAKLGLQGIAYPKFEEGEDGSDWNDLYRLRGFKNAADELNKAFVWAKKTQKERDEIEAEKKANEELEPLLHSLDFAVQIPPQEFIGGIFPKKFVSLVIAPPGSGKTMFMEKFVCDLSLGGTIFDGVAENEPERRILIFAGEAGFDMLLRRGKSFKWQNKLENVIVIDQHESELLTKSIMIDEDEGWTNVKRIINKVKPDIVFWDTFSSFHDKDENKAAEIKPLIRKIASLAAEKNFAAVLNHHTRKRLAKERNLTLNQDDVIGSSVFNRLAALIIGIEKDEDNIESDGKVLKVRPLKTWFKFFNSFNFTIGEDFWGHSTMTTDLEPKDVNNSRNGVWNYLVDTFKPGEWFSYSQIILSEITPPVSIAQVRRMLSNFVKSGKLQQRGTTRNMEYSIP
mgnify:FL=1